MTITQTYKPSGDKEAETKPQNTQKDISQMYGKDNKIKLDARFRFFRPSYD